MSPWSGDGDLAVGRDDQRGDAAYRGHGRGGRLLLALGFELLTGGPDHAFTTFRAGDSFLNLQLDPGHTPINEIWGRVIFWVADVDNVHARARAAGYEPSTAPADATWGERYFHIKDPDGHELSFARPLAALTR